jgi:hydroxymethylbilane synthase
MSALVIRIGTRDSALALWQAKKVQNLLEAIGLNVALVPTKSEGDLDLITPLYAMGVQGVFTKTLDAALLNNRIDIAVHSMKDVPIDLPAGIIQAAVLERANNNDVLVVKDKAAFEKKIANNEQLIIGTGSVRRKAQWLSKYPNSNIQDLRGNIATRLAKLHQENWDGAIFAAAALERLSISTESVIDLDWMLPAPAQGAIMVVCRTDDLTILNACKQINHAITADSVKIERDFLKLLMGGCSTPIAAEAIIDCNTVNFRGSVASENGALYLQYENQFELSAIENIASIAADNLLKQGADKIIKEIRKKI